MLNRIKWLSFALASAIAPQAFAQLAPTGDHYAGRPSDTGYGGTFVNATGTFTAAVPLELPPARGGIPIPLQIVYGARGVGAAGLGWDVPLSYIQQDATMAHHRPVFSPGTLPVPRNRAYLSLLGQGVELVQNGSDWLARSGTLELTVRESATSWLAYDGNGRTYTFVRPASLGNTGLWLLDSIKAAGGASVQLVYQIAILPLDGGAGTAIDLVRISYNSNIAQGERCAKNEVDLTYGNQSLTPLSISVLGDRILARQNTLTLADVSSRATCGSSLQRLRRYDFQYAADTDTGLPRLGTVRMFGRQGTPEENTPLPIATYGYGSATQNGKLKYERTQAIDLPSGTANDDISGTVRDASVNPPAMGNPPVPAYGYAMWQSLIDVNGDGRPDLVFRKNNKLWVAYNRPSPDGTTTLGTGSGQPIAQLSDATFTDGGISTHTNAQLRYLYGPANRNTANVWRQEIDVNGDGRIDIVDAAEEAGHWVVYLNTPGGPGGIQWQRRSFSVETLRAALVSGGHVIDGDFVPLSRRATGTNLKQWECWRWDGMNWNWYSGGFGNHPCTGSESEITDRGSERTFVEWQLLDLNGDGYPDFVFNSSPVDFQRIQPSILGTHPLGAVYQGGAEVPQWHQFAPAPTNEVRAMFNVRGVRFDSDDNPFSQPVSLNVAVPQQGVGAWGCTGINPAGGDKCDDSFQTLNAGFADVNGDGLMDRVDFNLAYLGVYSGAALLFSPVHITLPGPLATQHNTQKEQCVVGGGLKPTVNQTQGLRDLTGDGIPDYYAKSNLDSGKVWIGTGTGFRQPIDIEVAGGDFNFSHQTESCGGDKSNTDGGLFDIDGDGRPEVIGLVGNTFAVTRLAGGPVGGAPDAGRLTELNNGYGATTSITYVSAKTLTDNPVPFPEIVVTSAVTAGTQNPGSVLAGARYAYTNAEFVYDSALDRFTFPGYERVVEVRLYGTQPAPVGTAGGVSIAGTPTITDTWPFPRYNPVNNPVPMKQERWLRTQRAGRVRDIFTLRGAADSDPWSLLNVDANDTRVIGITHYEWDAKLYELSPNANPIDCLEMFFPLDFQRSLTGIGANGIDVCRAHGFAFAVSANSWYGSSQPPSDNNIQTRSRALAVDDFGRSIATEYDNDVFVADDDICVQNTFATPAGTFPRVLNALASRRIYDCGKDITFASESWAYDALPAGSVADGRPTSHNVDRRAGTGALLNTVHKFDATYDTSGNPATVRTQRDGSTRTITFGYDSFGLVPTNTRLDATGVPTVTSVTSYDPISLRPLSSTDANQTKRSLDLDGFGRPVRATVTLPGSALGVVSTASYLGFASTESGGRRIISKWFSDPVAPANVPAAANRTGTVFFDELGRKGRTELALGSDYANEVFVVGSRAYDGAGRIIFRADPYPKSQDSATAYGTSYLFKNTGDVDCVIRGRGQHALSMVTDVAAERFPTCFQRTFSGHVETLEVRDAASLQVGSPQAGVVKRVASTAIGRVIERSTWLAGARLEDATFSYDRIGQQVSMTRFLDPVMQASPVQWSMALDSVGQTLQLAEPYTATRTYRYSDWGEPVETQWVDGAINRQLMRGYDALGRLSVTEEHNNGVTDSETVNTYAYDVGVNVSPLVTPAFVAGQLARATSPSGQVTFSYDAFGRTNAQVFTDNQGGLYIEKSEQHADGSLESLQFNLPDQNYNKELVKYDYDSAGRLRSMQYADASGTRELYRAQLVDPFGHVRKALVGGNTVFHSVYADEGRRLMKEAGVDSSRGSRRLIFEQFDPVGRELSRREIKDGAPTGPETDVSYDALGRLGYAVKTDGGGTIFNWQYSYDPLGNLSNLGDVLGSAGAALSFRTDDRDRVCRIGYGPNGLGGTACNVSHDDAGNTIQQVTRTGVRNLSYFDSGNVRRISQGGAEASFRYDAFGAVQELDLTGAGVSDERHDRRYGDLIERRDQTVNGTTTTFISRKIPSPGGIVASRRGTKQDWVYQFGELRGNRFFVDGTGAFVQSVDYQPFGEANSSGAAPGSADYTSFQWNGDDALAAFGLSHLGARIYDPVIGRFLSRDPLLIPRTATTSNPYAFAVNDPVNASDPSGLDCAGGNIGQECQGLDTLNPLSLVGGLFNYLSGSGSSGAPPAPSVSAGPQTPMGQLYQAMAVATIGNLPRNFNPDTFAATGAGFSAMLDSIAQARSMESDATVDEYNARLDRYANYSRVVGWSLVVAGTGAIALSEMTGSFLAARGMQGAAEFFGFSVPGAASAGVASIGVENAAETIIADTEAPTLIHYTNEKGYVGILESEELNPSLKALSPKDARYGNGQYLSDILPGTKTPSQLSQTFLGVPWQGQKFTHYIEIDVSGLTVVQGRPGVLLIPGDAPLDLTGRIVSHGMH